jgi:hypothetical protein
MGFIVNKNIEESLYGELPSFYVRINSYIIDKVNSELHLTVGLYISKELSDISTSRYYGEQTDVNYMIGGIVKIDEVEFDTNTLLYHRIPIINEVDVVEDIFEDKSIPQFITYYDFNDDGELVEFEKEVEPIVEKVKVDEIIHTKKQMDIQSIMNDGFYSYCYNIVKSKFSEIFGEETIEDL